ncbi:MAG TPA: peptidyl-prolyl cis-trans isomerase [Polyangiaceae bacterium]|nr:peptidyl-prolyl cis-trans isomerase [Polyangiaceae bacterium]
MRSWWRRGLVAAALVALATGAGAGPEEVVARVGPEAITRGELEQRLASMPRLQLSLYGKTPDEIRRNVLERVLVVERLHEQAAVQRGLPERRDLRLRLRDAYRTALARALRAEAGAGPPSEADVAAYYEQHRDRFQSPERVQIWRILVATRPEALAVLEEAKKPEGLAGWAELARRSSLDKATSERGGDLGLVAPDGRSHLPAVRVEAAVAEAARKVKDGELVPEPVPEGDKFAVVWRRASAPPLSRTLEQEAPAIKQLLERQRAEGQTRALLDRLRAELFTPGEPRLVELIDVGRLGELKVKPASALSGVAPAPAPPERSAAPPRPSATPQGLR